MKKLILVLIILLFVSKSYSKGYYIVTLKGGTKIKAKSVIKLDGYIKVFKFGGYIIYPSKNIKSIQYKEVHKITENKNKNNIVKTQDNNTCEILVSNFKADPYFNPQKGIFNVEVKGILKNPCEDTFHNVTLNIKFMDKDKNLVAAKNIVFNEILPLSEKKFHKIFYNVVADNISYYLYKLQYLREK